MTVIKRYYSKYIAMWRYMPSPPSQTKGFLSILLDHCAVGPNAPPESCVYFAWTVGVLGAHNS